MVRVYENTGISLQMSADEIAEFMSTASIKDKVKVVSALFDDWCESDKVAEEISKRYDKERKKAMKSALSTKDPNDSKYHYESAKILRDRALAWKEIADLYKNE